MRMSDRITVAELRERRADPTIQDYPVLLRRDIAGHRHSFLMDVEGVDRSGATPCIVPGGED